jgi:hypothetical protein
MLRAPGDHTPAYLLLGVTLHAKPRYGSFMTSTADEIEGLSQTSDSATGRLSG